MESLPSTLVARQAALRRLADTLLGGKLDTYVADRRDAGKSWRLISLDLHDDIAVDISHETLRQWYGTCPTDRSAQ